MPKFFVRHEQINGDNIIVTGQDVNHIINVLRMKENDEIQICDSDNGSNYIAQIEYYQKDQVQCKIKEKILDSTESNVKITIFQGLPKFDKMELIIQKNTEIGVDTIVPVAMKRSIVKLNEKDKKIERWRKISEIAAKQSMRDIIPVIENVNTVNDMCNRINDFDLVLLAYEGEKNNTLKEELKTIKKAEQYNIAIIIGPEGGIDEQELEKFKQYNKLKIVTLGKRILRTETAGLVMSSNILYELEN